MAKLGSDTVPSEENANPSHTVSANIGVEETKADDVLSEESSNLASANITTKERSRENLLSEKSSNHCHFDSSNSALEETNAKNILSKQGSNLASANITTKERSTENLLSEKNSNHCHFDSSSTALEETNAKSILSKESSNLAPTKILRREINAVNVASAEKSNHSHSIFANMAMDNRYVNDSSGMEFYHDYYRFAYDLVELVLKIRRELNPDVKSNLPEPSNFLFTEKHAREVKCFLEQDTSTYLKQVHIRVNGVYNYENYMACRDYYVRKWKSTVYTEKSFICACATVAYLAAHFIQKNYHCGALDNAVMFIASWVEDIYNRGTINQSCW